MTVVLDIKELAGCESQGTSPIRVTLNKVPHLSFSWDATATSIPQAGVTGLENSDWTFSQTPTAWVWTYNKPVYNGMQISNIGFRGVWNAGATSGTADFNVSVINGSGGEANYLNNVDFERVIWSFIP